MKITQKTYSLKFLIVLFIVGVTALPILSQESTQEVINSRAPIADEDLAEFRELINYNKTKKKLKLKKSLEPKKEEEEQLQFEKTDLGGVGAAIQYLMYFVLIVLVVVLVIMIFSSIKIEKKLDEGDLLNLEDVDDIETIDAKSGLQMALEAGNYREAVRMLFIQLIQVLVSEESIKWKPEKTNRDYLREMSSHDKVVHFRNLVFAYEQVWYGEDEIDTLFFDYLRKDFERFYDTKDINIENEK